MKEKFYYVSWKLFARVSVFFARLYDKEVKLKEKHKAADMGLSQQKNNQSGRNDGAILDHQRGGVRNDKAVL